MPFLKLQDEIKMIIFTASQENRREDWEREVSPRWSWHTFPFRYKDPLFPMGGASYLWSPGLPLIQTVPTTHSNKGRIKGVVDSSPAEAHSLLTAVRLQKRNVSQHNSGDFRFSSEVKNPNQKMWRVHSYYQILPIQHDNTIIRHFTRRSLSNCTPLMFTPVQQTATL